MPPFPAYRQQDKMDCGPTCLRMIAKHYGQNIPIDSLRKAAGIGKEGVNLLGIAECAETIGFRTQGVQLTMEQLQTDAKLPCILHWSQQHFVVLYKIKRDTYFLADPAVGLARLTKNEFAKRWISMQSSGDGSQEDTPEAMGSGIALLLEPTPTFYNSEFDEAFSERGNKGFGFVVKYLYPYKNLLVIIALWGK